jgi:5-methylcytosine-specific restriction enzyme A
MPNAAPMFRASGDAGTASTSEPGYEQRRGSARARGYGPAWDRASASHRALHPLCVGCEAVGRVAVCDVVDHVVPHKGDAGLFWDEGNWQVACRWHHDVVKQQLERAWGDGELPASALRLDGPQAIALTLRLDPDRG